MTTPSDRTPDIPDLLAQSVLPMFVGDGDTPQRIGSCVLLSLFGQHLVVTAKHVFGKRDRQWFFIGRQQSKLIPLHVPGIHTVATPDEDLDVAVVPLTTHHVAAMNGLAFIPERYIEIEPERDQSTDDEFVVFGWPASNSTYRVERKTRNIRQASFYFRTTAARPDVARVEKIDLTTQLLVEFDPKKITVKGRPHTPPKPNGLSGGAVFHVVGGRYYLAAILTDNVKRSRVMVGVRASEVAAIAYRILNPVSHHRCRVRRPSRRSAPPTQHGSRRIRRSLGRASARGRFQRRLARGPSGSWRSASVTHAASVRVSLRMPAATPTSIR